MATSKNRETHNLKIRLDELRQRAAWATGEARMQLLEKIETIATQLRALETRRK